MTLRSHCAFWLLAFVLLALLPPLLHGPGPVRERLATEAGAIRGTFGAGASAWVFARADAAAGGRTAAGEPPRARGADRSWWWQAARGLAAAARALELQLQAIVLRAVLVAAWLLVLAPFWIAVCVDGFALRARKLETLGFQNPAAFRLAMHAAIVLAALPLLYLVAPFAVTPLFMAGWSLAAALPVGFALTHVPPVFTR